VFNLAAVPVNRTIKSSSAPEALKDINPCRGPPVATPTQSQFKSLCGRWPSCLLLSVFRDIMNGCPSIDQRSLGQLQFVSPDNCPVTGHSAIVSRTPWRSIGSGKFPENMYV